MDSVGTPGFTLTGLSRVNVILGKNGCGKSYLLKHLEQELRIPNRGKVRYITPERGGLLVYEPNIERSISSNPNWMGDTRRRNQSENFRQQSAVLFRRLELLVLRNIEHEYEAQTHGSPTFAATLDKLNTLLDRIRLDRDDDKAFRIVERESANVVPPEDISSGESELISLGIEFMSFVSECVEQKDNLLLVDEPDVHLHPDLQERLAQFLVSIVSVKASLTLIIATHSTSFLAGLAANDVTRVAFMSMKRNDVVLSFRPVSDVERMVLPIFGAHPLSQVFNEKPILLLEGEDDERVWQQALRSSVGNLKIYPRQVDGLGALPEVESVVRAIIEAVYDNGRGYSLRDGDSVAEPINDLGCIVRMRLGCRAAENLMLSDDTLKLAGVAWPELQAKIQAWIDGNPSHKYHGEMKAFAEAGFDRKGYDLKEIRNIIIGEISSKPWEVLVGQAIASVVGGGGESGPESLRDYLGEKVCANLLDAPAVRLRLG